MPRPKKIALDALCHECGATFQTTRGARFCCPVHQVAFGNRMAARGKVFAPYVMAWISGKGGGHRGSHPVVGKCLSEITAIVREFIDEDKAAGRPPSTAYAEALFAEGFLYCDRKRTKRRP